MADPEAKLLKADRWLETELARQFCPVSAPDALWRQIHEQRRPLRVRSDRWRTWSVAAACSLMLVAALVWRFGATRDLAADLETIAARELRGVANGTGAMDFRSDDPREIQAWVKAKSGIDVQLPERQPFGNGPVRLVGARLIESDGSSVAVVAYRVGDDSAAMVVEGRRANSAGNSTPGHTSLRSETTGELRLYSWSVGTADYAIAFGGMNEPQRACLLCHADAPALMVFR